MSSRVPLELNPIQEEKPSFSSSANILNDPLLFDISRPGPSTEYPPTPDAYESDQMQKFASIGLEITSVIIGNVISHPCIVLRRQCQVNRKASRYHLSPFTILPVLVRLHNRQGLLCLWKGCSGVFILRGCAAVLETFLTEITPFPREVSSNSSLKQISQHLFLKLITFGILAPFYCANLVETVQSDIASEKPGVLDCLKEGICRLIKLGTPQSTRLLPMWQLIGPTALLGLSTYTLSSIIYSVIHWFHSVKVRNTHERRTIENIPQSSTVTYLNHLSTLHFSSFVTSVLLYPAETVLHRLYLQGTRTIIDDLDSGTSVLPVITRYEGVSDCFHSIVAEEGRSGLYKGLGALILEYALQALIVKVVKVVFTEVESILRPRSITERS